MPAPFQPPHDDDTFLDSLAFEVSDESNSETAVDNDELVPIAGTIIGRFGQGGVYSRPRVERSHGLFNAIAFDAAQLVALHARELMLDRTTLRRSQDWLQLSFITPDSVGLLCDEYTGSFVSVCFVNHHRVGHDLDASRRLYGGAAKDLVDCPVILPNALLPFAAPELLHPFNDSRCSPVLRPYRYDRNVAAPPHHILVEAAAAAAAWSLGVCLYGLRYGELPFQGKTREAVADAIHRADGPCFSAVREAPKDALMTNEHVDVGPGDDNNFDCFAAQKGTAVEHEWQRLLRQLCHRDPRQRLSALALSRHPILEAARNVQASNGLDAFKELDASCVTLTNEPGPLSRACGI